TEVGQHQMWAAQFIDREKPRTFISSGGLGTMGFGFPAAIGAAFGRPDDQVVCVAGDGSFQMNSQEMATAAINGVPVKVLILDNRALGMVHQWQKLFYNERYSFTELSANPDFCKLADAYSWKSRRITAPEEVDAALDEMLACEGPFLLDVAIPDDQNVFPMVAPARRCPTCLAPSTWLSARCAPTCPASRRLRPSRRKAPALRSMRSSAADGKAIPKTKDRARASSPRTRTWKGSPDEAHPVRFG
ncbi:thiamine pyrophosphate-dependent enzyme, partial [Senegalimassilia anaerobia]|uniref:thiamine pyrophosphate-dependent enzyme n=1 Tax=Senegalimassilia anaerobia TaxID=1473216 RepID=UPI002E778F91